MYDAGIYLEDLTRVGLEGALDFYVESRFTGGDRESVEVMLGERVGFGLVKGMGLRRFLDREEEGGRFFLSLLKDEVRVVAVLWREVVHGLIRRGSERGGTWGDLRGLERGRVVVGGVGDSGFHARRWLFPFLGWEEGEKAGVWEGGGLKDAEGVVWLSGVPSREVGELMATGDWLFLDMTKRQGLSLRGASGGTLRMGRLEEGSYEGIEGGRDVLAQYVYLLALKGISSSDVYNLTKVLFEERCRLVAMSGLFYGVLPLEEQVGRGEDVWLWHEGAKRYYEESMGEGFEVLEGCAG